MNYTLQRYIPVAELIAKTFGHNCEVVIHDLSIPQNSVVYAINNHVTGRKVGQSFDHLVKQVLLSQQFINDCSSNYLIQGLKGQTVKSSTALIRDENNKVIGALCVNMDVTAIENSISFLNDFLGLPAKEEVKVDSATAEDENEVEVIGNIMEIVDDLIDKIIRGYDLENMTRTEKIDLIGFMNAKGIFSIKGTIDKVAEKMGISKVTVYSYLDEVKKSHL